MLKWSKRNSIFEKYYRAPINKTTYYEIICNYGQIHVNFRWNATRDMANNKELARIRSYFYSPAEINEMKIVAEAHYKKNKGKA